MFDTVLKILDRPLEAELSVEEGRISFFLPLQNKTCSPVNETSSERLRLVVANNFKYYFISGLQRMIDCF